MHMTHKHKLSILSLAVTLYYGDAYAQVLSDTESDIEVVEVIGQPNLFGALKSNTPLLETARSVSIETFDQFIEKGALTLDDTLNYSAGVVGDTFGFSTRGDFIKVRGFDAFEYRDGMQSLSGNYNNTRPELYTLEQVEVLKGPASVLFGPGSPGGIVNIVTKRPNANARNEVAIELGSFDRQQIAVDVSGNHSDGKLLTRFVGLYRDSDTQISEVNDDSIVLAPSFTLAIDDVTKVSLLFDYTKRESNAAHQFLPLTGTLRPLENGQFTDPTAYLGEPGFNKFDTESMAVTLLAEHQLNDVWSLDLSSRYRDGESTYRQTWIAFLGTGTPRVDANGFGARSWFKSDGFSTQFQIDFRARAQFSTGDADHSLLIGASHQTIDNRTDTSFLGGVDFTTFLPVGGITNVLSPITGNMPLLPDISRGLETQDNITGLYIHDQIEYLDWLVNLGLRFDDVENSLGDNADGENAISVSASIMYQFDSGISPYINYSESFTPVPGVDDITQRALKPQEGEQVELGVKFQPTRSNHFVSAAYFEIDLSNLANPNALTAGGNGISQQEGISSVDGLEIESIFNFEQVSVELNYTSLDSATPDGFQRDSIPEEQASIWASYRPVALDNLTLGGGIRYVGASQSTDLLATQTGFLTIDTPSYTVFDLHLGYKWNAWNASLNVRNATDKQYFTTCLARGDCYPGEQRGVTARLTYQF